MRRSLPRLRSLLPHTYTNSTYYPFAYYPLPIHDVVLRQLSTYPFLYLHFSYCLPTIHYPFMMYLLLHVHYPLPVGSIYLFISLPTWLLLTITQFHCLFVSLFISLPTHYLRIYYYTSPTNYLRITYALPLWLVGSSNRPSSCRRGPSCNGCSDSRGPCPRRHCPGRATNS